MEQKKSSEKDYRKRSPHYFLIGLVVALSTTLLAFEYRTFDYETPDCQLPPVTIEPPDELPPIYIERTKKLPPPKPKPIPPAPIPDPEPLPDPTVVIDSAVVIEPEVFLNDSVFGDEPFVNENIPIITAEVMPEFEGGLKKLYKFLGKNIKYPELAREVGLEAKVYVQFVVNKDGSVSDIEVLNPAGNGFDKEAMRVIAMMPEWKPGKQAGRKVRVYYIIPINFALNH